MKKLWTVLVVMMLVGVLGAQEDGGIPIPPSPGPLPPCPPKLLAQEDGGIPIPPSPGPLPPCPPKFVLV